MTVAITQISPSADHAGPWVPVVLDVTTTNITTYTYILATIGAQQVVVWGDGTWNPLFVQYSTRTTLVADTSYRYSLLPSGGWRVGFTLDVRAGEAAGGAAWPAAITKSVYCESSTKRVVCSDKTTSEYLESSEAFTVNFWLKLSTSGNWGTVNVALSSLDVGMSRGFLCGAHIGESAAPWFLLSTDGSHQLSVRGGTNIKGVGWRMVTFTHDGSGTPAGVGIYVNAVPEACVTIANTLGGGTTHNTAYVSFLGLWYEWSTFLPGRMCAASLHNRVIGSSEVAMLFNGGAEAVNPNVVAGCVRAWPLGSADVWPILREVGGSGPCGMQSMSEADILTDAP